MAIVRTVGHGFFLSWPKDPSMKICPWWVPICLLFVMFPKKTETYSKRNSQYWKNDKIFRFGNITVYLGYVNNNLYKSSNKNFIYISNAGKGEQKWRVGWESANKKSSANKLFLYSLAKVPWLNIERSPIVPNWFPRINLTAIVYLQYAERYVSVFMRIFRARLTKRMLVLNHP